MRLLHFDDGLHPAAENMALDLLLLEHFPEPDALRFRHYGWSKPAFTFGYSQSIGWIRGQAGDDIEEIIRRPSGGGLVDHRNDWTFAFAIPASHPLWRGHAEDVYRLVHEAVAEGLVAGGRPAALAPERGKQLAARVQGMCFTAPEPFDVIDPRSGQKLAGAAMKRNRHGLLLQGSADRIMIGDIDWEKFLKQMLRSLCLRFGATTADAVASPVYPADARREAEERFSSKEWNERR